MRSMRKFALNRWDLALGVLALLVISSGAVWTIVFQIQDDDWTTAVAILAGLITILVAGIGAAIKITTRRRNLISLFSSEIKAIQYGLSTMDMFGFWTKVHAHPEKAGFGFADVPRAEDYFATYHSVSDNIGDLHPTITESVVRFYTYLKMSRDAAAALHAWATQTDLSVRRMDVEYVVQLLALSMLWGFVALRCMGFEALPQDQEFLGKIWTGYDAVIGTGKFQELRRGHSRSTWLAEFFEEGREGASIRRKRGAGGGR
jgi:hypothetical protein